MRYQLQGIPAGEAGTDATVRRMGDLVRESSRRPFVRLQALRITERANVPENQSWAAAAALFRWVKSAVRFVPDPVDVETLQSPEVTLRIGAGDCDDQATLVAALAQAIGIPARFRVIGQSRSSFSHVYPELFVAGRWYAADTVGAKRFGQAIPQQPAEKVYSVSGVPAMSFGLGEDQKTGLRVTGLPREAAYRAAYQGAMAQLKRNWNAGRINRSDLRSYVRVISEGNSPAFGTFLEPPVKQAVQDFLKKVLETKSYSRKPESQTGLAGLGIVLSTVVNAAKDAVSNAWNDFKGSVDIQPPQIIVQTPPQATQAGVTTALQSPITWAIVGAMILIPTLLARR